MHILQLCHKPPYPPSDGGSIAMNQITRGLIDHGIGVKVMALAPTGTGEATEKIPEKYKRETGLEVFPVDTRVKLIPAFCNLFTRRSYNISRFYSPAFAKRLGQLLEEESFDIIQLEGLFLTPYVPVIRKHTGASLLFRSHNIEHFIWERMARSTKNPLKKTYLKILAARLKSYEMKTVHQVDGLVAISPVDLRFFKRNGFAQPAVTVPVGVTADPHQPYTGKVHNNTVFHIGSMDWRPNQDGLQWFLEEVWPLVIAKRPDLQFNLAGRNIPASFYRYNGKHVKVVGEVPDALGFMQTHKLMVVPLRSGGGMRVKIIEAMAAGKAIISTSIGAEGIDCTHGENILLADTASEMAEAIIHCFSSPAVMKEIEDQAVNFVFENHNMSSITGKLIGFYKRFYGEGQ